MIRDVPPGLHIDTGNADGSEADQFWTSLHNHNRRGKAVNDALAAEEARLMEWVNQDASRRERWRRVLGEISETDGWDSFERQEHEKEAILRALRALPWSDAGKLLNVIVQNTYKRGLNHGAASVVIGRPDKWTSDVLFDLLADIEEAPGENLTARREHVAEARGMDIKKLQAREREARKLLKSRK